ncbi:MAG: hypothetical protein HWE07_04730 [Cytophagia bacterium]|nr:hypothetical protein [Cytophagia bacterium]
MVIGRLEKQFGNSLKHILFLGLLVFYVSCENSRHERENLVTLVIDIKELNTSVNEVTLIELIEKSRNEFLPNNGGRGVLILYHDSMSNQRLYASFHINLSEMYYCPPSYSSIYKNIPIAIYSSSEFAVKDSTDIRRLYANFMNDDMIGYKAKEDIEIDGEIFETVGIQPLHITTTYRKRIWELKNGQLIDSQHIFEKNGCDFSQELSNYFLFVDKE